MNKIERVSSSYQTNMSACQCNTSSGSLESAHEEVERSQLPSPALVKKSEGKGFPIPSTPSFKIGEFERSLFLVGPYEIVLPPPEYLLPQDTYPFVTRSLPVASGGVSSKKVIVFGLFSGEKGVSAHNDYTIGLLVNIRSSQGAYPGWKVRIYWDQEGFEKDFAVSLRKELEAYKFVEIMTPAEVAGMDKIQKMAQRFFVAADDSVDVFMIRDADSRFIQREVDAVEEWLATDKAFHFMRDGIAHDYPILGGAWGGRRHKDGGKIDIVSLLHQFVPADQKQSLFSGNEYNNDQFFLKNRIFPLIHRDQYVSHDTFYCEKYHARPYPAARTGLDIVGKQYFANGKPKLETSFIMHSYKSNYPNGAPKACTIDKGLFKYG
uniref:Uncharacterized protein n=1 Tax=Palpitomonas bilix TaxID=652834 RepID=A0A7S3DDV1_9EUKA